MRIVSKQKRNDIFSENNLQVKIATLILCFWISASVEAQETPRATIQAAIKAHGGAGNVPKGLTRWFARKATRSPRPELTECLCGDQRFGILHRRPESIKGR